MKTLIGLLFALSATVCLGQNVIRVVVPFAAGGVQDIIARSISAELGTALGRSVIVENRAGAGGTIGNARRRSTRCCARTSRRWRGW